MTTITKIFIILVCLFAFIFTPMAIQFAARTRNWRELAVELQTVAETALAHERSTLAVAASSLEHHKSLRAEERRRVEARDEQIGNLEQGVSDLTRDRDLLGKSRDSWEESARVLTAELAVTNRHNEELTTAKEEALARERRLQTDNIRLNNRVKDLSADNVVLAQHLKRMKEQMVAYREENEQLRRAAGLDRTGPMMDSGPTATATPIAPAATSPITGKVTDVKGELVSVNVGSASGVKEGMRMVVTRDNNDYICDLEIESVRPNEAVGRIAMMNTDGKRVRADDLVEDLNSFKAH